MLQRKTTRKVVLVLIGLQGSGKDTVSDFIVKLTNGRTKHLAFADTLRNTCWQIFGHKIINRTKIYGNATQKSQPIKGWLIPDHTADRLGVERHTEWTGRYLLQWMGTEVCREDSGSDNLWVTLLLDQLRCPHTQLTIVTDCCFPNEYKALWDLRKENIAVHFIRIQRDGVALIQVNEHSSESHIHTFDCQYTLNNNNTIIDLKAETVKLLTALGIVYSHNTGKYATFTEYSNVKKFSLSTSVQHA